MRPALRRQDQPTRLPPGTAGLDGVRTAEMHRSSAQRKTPGLRARSFLRRGSRLIKIFPTESGGGFGLKCTFVDGRRSEKELFGPLKIGVVHIDLDTADGQRVRRARLF